MDIKERILENSMELFLRRGCKSVTMDDIASENGISKRTLYELFGDKSSLLEQSILLIENKKKCFFEEYSTKTDNVLERFIKIHESQSEMMVNLRINFFYELKKYYPAIYSKSVDRLVNFHLERLVQSLTLGREQGIFRTNFDIELTAKIVIELGNTMGNFDIFPLEKIGRKKLFRELMITYFRGISTQKGIEIIDRYLNSKND